MSPGVHIHDPAAAQRVVRVANHEAVALKGRDRFREPYLSPSRLTGWHGIAVEEEELPLDLRGAGMERDRQVVPDRAPGIPHRAETHINGRDGIQGSRPRYHHSA